MARTYAGWYTYRLNIEWDNRDAAIKGSTNRNNDLAHRLLLLLLSCEILTEASRAH